MNARLDVLRSLVRAAASSAAGALRALPGRAALGRLLSELKRRRLALPEAVLTRAVARVDGVSAATVRAHDGALRCSVSYQAGHELGVSLHPLGARFAPGGAKELSFRVEPARHAPAARELVAAVAAQVAKALWGSFLPRSRTELALPPVSTEHDTVTVDLRDVPLVRRGMKNRVTVSILDVLEVRHMCAEDQALWLTLRLPGLESTRR